MILIHVLRWAACWWTGLVLVSVVAGSVARWAGPRKTRMVVLSLNIKTFQPTSLPCGPYQLVGWSPCHTSGWTRAPWMSVTGRFLNGTKWLINMTRGWTRGPLTRWPGLYLAHLQRLFESLLPVSVAGCSGRKKLVQNHLIYKWLVW